MLHRFHPDLARLHLRVAHRELRAAWRNGTLPQWRLVLAPLLVLGVLGSALPGPWRWIAGLGTGLGAASWLLLGDHLFRIERWRTQVGGAQRTLRVVDGLLQSGWRIAPADGLVLVGRTGVLVVESVSWSGTVSLVSGVPVRTFADDPDGAVAMTGLPARMRRLATGCAETVDGAAEVTPVVVIWGDFPAAAIVDDGIAYVRGDAFADWIGARRPRLQPVPTVLAAAA